MNEKLENNNMNKVWHDVPLVLKMILIVEFLLLLLLCAVLSYGADV